MKNPCPNCGIPLDEGGLAGLCPRCLALDFLTPTGFNPGAQLAACGELPPPEERQVGDYELLEELGRGGMGVVYRARQLSLNRDVAIKFLLHGALAGDQAMARFRAEAEAVAGLRHPNIVAIHEVGEDRGRHFQAMELVEGQSLAKVLREGPMAAVRAAGYVRSVAEALHYSHEHGVIHRDLKPANVLIDHRDEPRVTDFGLAKRFGSAADGTPIPELTLSGEVVGTPAYLSPEQAEGAAVDARSDVYSLGALLYHLITGRPPFVGESATQVLRQVVEAEPVAPKLLNPSVPRDLETICLKCLEKEPARRYGSARSLAEDLSRFLRDEPIIARPVAPAERAWRWCKRNPALATSAAGIAALLAGIAIVSTTSAHHIERLRIEGLTNLYASDMRLAQHAIDESKFGAAAELLARHTPKPGDPDLRGFEWWHFQDQCRSDETASLETQSNQVARVAFSPDGRFVATGATEVQVLELATRRPVFRLLIHDYVWALSFSPEGDELLVGDASYRVFRFDIRRAKTGKTTEVSSGTLLGTLTNLDARPLSFFWSGKEPGLRVVLQNGLLAWDGISQQATRIASFDSAFTRLQVSRDGSISAALQGPSLVASWRLDPPTKLREFKPPGLSRSVSISPDGQRIAAGDFAGVVRIWELKPDGTTNMIQAHRGLVDAVAFSPDSELVASAGADQIIRLHDAIAGTKLGEWRGHRATVLALAFSPDGRWLVSGDKRGEVKLWDLERRPHAAALAGRFPISLSEDGARLAHWTAGSPIVVHATTALQGSGQSFPAANFSGILLSSRGLSVITANGKLQSLESHGGWREHPLGEIHLKPAWGISPDGRYAALTAREAGGPFVWDLLQDREVLRLTNDPTWLSPTFDAASHRLASGTAWGQVRVWELPSGREIASFLAHQHTYAYACDLSPDGELLATAGFDGLVKLWEIRGPRLIGEYRSSADAYWTVALSPDGRRIAAGTSESSIVLWDIPSRQEVATFHLGEPLRPAEGLLRFTPDGSALLHANGTLKVWTAPAHTPGR